MSRAHDTIEGVAGHLREELARSLPIVEPDVVTIPVTRRFAQELLDGITHVEEGRIGVLYAEREAVAKVALRQRHDPEAAHDGLPGVGR